MGGISVLALLTLLAGCASVPAPRPTPASFSPPAMRHHHQAPSVPARSSDQAAPDPDALKTLDDKLRALSNRLDREP